MKTKDPITALYLYSDGHAIVLREATIKHSIKTEYAVIYEKLVDAKCNIQFKGRIVFHRYDAPGFLTALKGAKRVEAKVPHVSHGSEATRKLGQPVGELNITLAGGGELRFYYLPGLLGGGWTYDEQQAGINEIFSDQAMHWGSYTVLKVIPAKNNVAAAK